MGFGSFNTTSQLEDFQSLFNVNRVFYIDSSFTEAERQATTASACLYLYLTLWFTLILTSFFSIFLGYLLYLHVKNILC